MPWGHPRGGIVFAHVCGRQSGRNTNQKPGWQSSRNPVIVGPWAAHSLVISIENWTWAPNGKRVWYKPPNPIWTKNGLRIAQNTDWAARHSRTGPMIIFRPGLDPFLVHIRVEKRNGIETNFWSGTLSTAAKAFRRNDLG